MKLFDSYGREIDTGRLKEEQSAPTPTLRSIYSNLYPSTGLDVEKLTMIHRQADFGDPYLYLELAEEMEEKDSHYLAVLNKRRLTAASLDINVEAGGDDPASQKITEFVKRTLLDATGFNLRENLFDILDALGKGFSVNEIIWNTEKRLSLTKGAPNEMWWVPERLEPRDQRWFMFDWISGRQVLVRSLRSDGQGVELKQKVVDKTAPLEMTAMKDQPPHAPKTFNWNRGAATLGIQPLTERLAPYKYVTHYGRAKSGLPIRAGFARCVSWPYLFKNFAIKDWATFAERFGQPIRVGIYPAGATAEDRAALLAAVGGLGADTAGIIPQGSDIKFQAAGGLGDSANLYKSYMDYLENLISKLILGSTLGTQLGDGAGSRAAAQVHRGVEISIVEADGIRLGGILTRDLVKPLVDLNFGPQQNYPIIKIGVDDGDESGTYVTNVTELADRGMPIGVSQIYEKLGLVEPKEGEKLLSAKAPQAQPGDPSGGGGNPNGDGGNRPPPRKPGQAPPDDPLRARLRGNENPDDANQPALHTRKPASKRLTDKHARYGHPADIVSDFAERLGADWKRVGEPLVNPVLDLASSASGYKDFLAKLSSVAYDMDPRDFEEQLARALNAAYLAGRLTESDKGAT